MMEDNAQKTQVDPAVEGGQASPSMDGDVTQGDATLKKLRQEAANYRVQRNEERAKSEGLEARLNALETSKLEEEGKYRELAEQRSIEIKEMKLARTTNTDAMRSRLLKSRLRSDLASAGIVDKGKQDLLLPGLVSQSKVEWTDDHEMTGNMGDVIASAVSTFGVTSVEVKAQDPSPNTKARMHPAAKILSHQLPGSSTNQGAASASERFRSAVMERAIK